MGKSSVGKMGIPFKRFDELCGCEGVVTGAVECPFMGGCSLYFKKSLSPCLDRRGSALGDTLLIKQSIPEAHFCNRNAIQRAQQSVFATKRLVREYDGPGVDVFGQVIENLVSQIQFCSCMTRGPWRVDTLESREGN